MLRYTFPNKSKAAPVLFGHHSIVKFYRNHPITLRWISALFIGFVGLCQFHLPQFDSGFDTFPGDRGDARLVAYLMEHWYRVFCGNENWLSPQMFYPVQGTFGYADLVLGYGLMFSVLRSLHVGLLESAQFTIIAFNFLNYVACFILLHKVLRLHLLASCVGAVFFAFNSPKLVQMGHLQLQPTLFLPIAAIPVVLLVQKSSTLSQSKAFLLLSVTALSITLQLLTGFYQGWFFVFWASLFLLVLLLFRESRHQVVSTVRRFWLPIFGSAVVLGIGLIPFVKAYLPAFRESGGRKYIEVLKLIPEPVSLLVMGERNRFWGDLAVKIKSAHPLHPELQIGIGLIPTIVWFGLTLWAVAFLLKQLSDRITDRNEYVTRAVKSQYALIAALVIATTLVYVLGMRYGPQSSPWQYVYEYYPGARGVRAVSRYALTLALPMAIGFSFLVHKVDERLARTEMRKRVIGLIVLFLIAGFGLAEQFAHAEGFNGFSIAGENAYLRKISNELPRDCASFYVAVGPGPLHNQFEYQIDAVLVSAMRGVPTLNGYSGQLPPDWALWEVSDPQYEDNVVRWVQQHGLPGKICRLFIDEASAITDINDPDFFVRQQYRDILGREPDDHGLVDWANRLRSCKNKGGMGADPTCDRVYVSLGILSSTEYMERSYFVFRLYRTALARLPSYSEFLSDRQGIVTSTSREQENANKQTLLKHLTQRDEFKSAYDDLSNKDVVERLMANASVTALNREALVSELDRHVKTRAQVLQTIVNENETMDRCRAEAFVMMQFFANLARDPKPEEYQERLRSIMTTGDYRQVVFDFIYSVEYRKRFGYVN
jgi:hypothetical protein